MTWSRAPQDGTSCPRSLRLGRCSSWDVQNRDVLRRPELEFELRCGCSYCYYKCDYRKKFAISFCPSTISFPAQLYAHQWMMFHSFQTFVRSDMNFNPLKRICIKEIYFVDVKDSFGRLKLGSNVILMYNRDIYRPIRWQATVIFNLFTGLTAHHHLQQLKNCDKQQFRVDIVQSGHYLNYH